MNTSAAFQRFELLTGKEALSHINSATVIIFGIGGVGSWCAEALVRSGIEHLTIVDSDRICITNVNRQIHATMESIGNIKVAVLRERLLSINPNASVNAVQQVYNRDTAESFNLPGFDYCIDAIDSLSNKIDLIVHAYNSGCKLYSALGASCKLDPTRIKVNSIWKSEGCHLGRFVRKRLRKRKFSGDFTCVYSDELLTSKGSDNNIGCGTSQCFCPKSTDLDLPMHEWCSIKKQINGSAVHITGVFGFLLAGLIIQDIIGNHVAENTSDAYQKPQLDTISG